MNKEFRIRELQREDLSIARQIIRNGLYGLFRTGLKILCWKNRNVLGIMTMITATFTALFEGNIIISLIAQILFWFLASILQFINEVEHQINDLNDFDEMENRYVKFWVMEHIQKYGTFIVGTVALKAQEDVTNRQPISTVELKVICFQDSSIKSFRSNETLTWSEIYY
ncbi:uncharacterized protein LOC144424320 [Styela clava]